MYKPETEVKYVWCCINFGLSQGIDTQGCKGTTGSQTGYT